MSSACNHWLAAKGTTDGMDSLIVIYSICSSKYMATPSTCLVWSLPSYLYSSRYFCIQLPHTTATMILSVLYPLLCASHSIQFYYYFCHSNYYNRYYYLLNYLQTTVSFSCDPYPLFSCHSTVVVLCSLMQLHSDKVILNLNAPPHIIVHSHHLSP